MSADGSEHLFNSIANNPAEGFFRRMWKPIAGGVLVLGVLALAGYYLPAPAKHGVDALQPGMTKDQVIGTLGKPSCGFDGNSIELPKDEYDDLLGERFSWPQKSLRSNLVYSAGSDSLLVIEFNAHSTIYKWTRFQFGGALAEAGKSHEICAAASVGSAGLGGTRTSTGEGFEFRDWNTGVVKAAFLNVNSRHY